jgi:hypothetical protein
LFELDLPAEFHKLLEVHSAPAFREGLIFADSQFRKEIEGLSDGLLGRRGYIFRSNGLHIILYQFTLCLKRRSRLLAG